MALPDPPPAVSLQQNNDEKAENGGLLPRAHYTVIAEKTLFDVLAEVWRARFILAGFAALGVVLAFFFMALSRPYYRAQMIIAPVYPMGMSAAGAGAGGAGSGSGVEGTINGGDPSAARGAAFSLFEAIYSGTSVASFLAQDQDFLSALAQDQAFVFSHPPAIADAQTLSEYLERYVHLDPVSGASALRRLSYLHPDKKFAADFLTRIHRITDEMIRARVLAETNQRITYLHHALEKTNNPEHKRSLAALLMEQERVKMMVSLDQPYAASIVEPAFVSSLVYWPDAYLVYPVFVFIMLIFGYIVSIQRYRKNSGKQA